MTFSALDSRLTGPLFATDAMREVFSDEARLAAMLRAEAALARAQARLGLVPEALAAAIEAIRPDALDADALGRRTALAGVPTIPFVKAVQALLPADLVGSFHKGTTTQDILDTATVLQMKAGIGLMLPEVAAIVAGLAGLAEAHRLTPCVGRTYGQQAAPLTFGYKVAIWCLGIAESGAALAALRPRVLAASLGGPVGTLASLGAQGPAVLAGFAAELGLAEPTAAWHADRGRIVEAGTALARLIGSLAKMAGDVVDLVSTEVAELAEPYQPGRGGSSAMPHKRNPVSSTVILAAHGAAKGHVVALLDAMAVPHERPAGAWHAEWHALPQLFGLASGALREARILAEGLEVAPERMRANLDATRGLLFADAAQSRLAPILGREAAGAAVERAADRVRAEGIAFREALEEGLGQHAAAAADALDRAFDLTPSLDAAALWADRALAEARRTA